MSVPLTCSQPQNQRLDYQRPTKAEIGRATESGLGGPVENVAFSKRIRRDARPPWATEVGLCQGSPEGLFQETVTELLNNDTIFILYLLKFCLVKAMVSPVVMYRCESWAIKKAECRRIDVFKLWCWRRLLRVPWTARRSNQSILKEINPEYSLEGLMLKLKLQYSDHLM